MLPRTQRLSRDQDIRAVLRHGACSGTATVRLCVLVRSEGPSRLAVIVGSKVSRSAVVRHRWQRRLRAMGREMLERLSSAKSCDMVWIAQPGITAVADSPRLQDDMMVLMRRLRLLDS